MAKKKEMSLEEKQADKLKKYEEAHAKLLTKFGLSQMLVIEFPGKKTVPALSRLALRVIARQGGRIAIRYIDLKK